MPKSSQLTPKVKQVIPGDNVRTALNDLVAYLLKSYDFESGAVALVGIQTRGAVIAKRVAEIMKSQKMLEIQVGALDITLYRDDFSTSDIQPVIGETHLDFDIDEKTIILIDDVLFTGRTIRAALDELIDFGRPKAIGLAVLVDRGHRELPIQPDFASLKISTQRDDSVHLHLLESDGKDEIVIYEAVKE